MNYTIIAIPEKILAGISTNTSNYDPLMGEKIGQLWASLYKDGVSQQIQNKVNDYTIGLYSDYTQDGYTVTAGFEVSKADNNGLSTKIIPAGTYAKFQIHGHMVNAVAKAWQEIWKMDLNRTYTGDFEEYHNNDFENGEVCIYVAIKDTSAA